jgi:hypothetical protein
VIGTPDEATSNLDTVRKRLDVVTRKTRFSLVQNILGHQSGPPTPKELDDTNPSRSRTAIRQHSGRLVEAGVVENVELPENRRQNDLSYAFYEISDEGRRSLEEHGLLRAEATLREVCDRAEKPAGIGRYESASRPDR